MGALFELLAELIVAITVAALAQFGVSLDGVAARSDQPAIERTVLRTAPQASAAVTEEDCDDAAHLQSA